MLTEKSQSADNGDLSSAPAGPPGEPDAPAGDTRNRQRGILSETNEPGGHKPVRARRLLVGAAAVLGLAILAVFGIPWIKLMLTTVSTDDAYVNGHVTFVAARVPGQVSKVLVDDNKPCQQRRSSRGTRYGAKRP